jgi:hypothetical protein
VRLQCIDVEFQEFQLDSVKGGNGSELVMKIWVFQDHKWHLLMNLDIQLQGLLYCDEPLGKNCVMIDLIDGKYIVPTNPIDLEWYKQMIQHSNHTRMVKSLNFDTLLKLNGLELSIEDINVSKLKIAENITADDTVIDTHRIDQLKRMIIYQRDQMEIKREKLSHLEHLRQQRAKRIGRLKAQLQARENELQTQKEDFSGTLIQYETMINDMAIEKSKISRMITLIFPIEDMAHWLGIPQFDTLPLIIKLDDIESLDHHEADAALGYLTHMTTLLSNYLAVPLRYKLRFFGSFSMVTDNISQIQQRRVFPLFYTQHFHRFQYGVLLLVANMNDIMEERYHY